MEWKRWGRVGLAAAIGMVGVVEGGGDGRAPIPALGYHLATVEKSARIPWISARISKKIPNVALLDEVKFGSYKLYNKNRQPTIEHFGSYYFQDSDKCSVTPIDYIKGIFYETCNTMFGPENAVVDFLNNRKYGEHFILVSVVNGRLILLSSINAQVRSDRAALPWPEITELDISSGWLSIYSFGGPGSEYEEELINCLSSNGINEYRGLLPDYTRKGGLIVMIPQDYSILQNGKLIPACRLRFVFDLNTKTGRYFKI